MSLSEDEMFERIQFWMKDRDIKPLSIQPEEITDEIGIFTVKVLIAGLPHDFDKFVIHRISGSFLHRPSDKLVYEVQRKLKYAEHADLEDEFNFAHIILMHATDIKFDEIRTYMPDALKGVLYKQSWYKNKSFKGNILESEIKDKLREIKLIIEVEDETTLADLYDINSVRILSTALAVWQGRDYMNSEDVEKSVLLYRIILKRIIDPIEPKLARMIDPKLDKNKIDEVLKFTKMFDLKKWSNVDISIAEVSSRIGYYYAEAKIDAKLKETLLSNIKSNKCIGCGKETNKRCEICLVPLCDNCIPIQIGIYRRCKKHLDVELN